MIVEDNVRARHIIEFSISIGINTQFTDDTPANRDVFRGQSVVITGVPLRPDRETLRLR